MTNETKIEKMIEDLAVSMAKGFEDQEKRFDKKIEVLTRSMINGFEDQEKRFDKKLDNLAVSMAKGFDEQNQRFEKRFEKLENDSIWIKNTLEGHSTVLDRLDQERVFTINHVNRLEDEINKIRKQPKIA